MIKMIARVYVDTSKSYYIVEAYYVRQQTFYCRFGCGRRASAENIIIILKNHFMLIFCNQIKLIVVLMIITSIKNINVVMFFCIWVKQIVANLYANSKKKWSVKWFNDSTITNSFTWLWTIEIIMKIEGHTIRLNGIA